MNPDGDQLDYAYTGLDAAVSRPTSLSGQGAGSGAAVTHEAFKYLGLGTVIERSRPEVNAALSMVSVTGATGDAGDKYTGLDRFGRVVDQRWTQGTTATSPVLDRYGYTYDRNSNRLTRSNALAAAFSETYAYDAMNQLQSFARTSGTTTSQQWQFDALGNWTTVTTNGVAATGTGGLEERVYALRDANWNTTAIIAATGVPGVAAGTVLNRFVYTPYGESQTLTASWATPPAGLSPFTPWAHLFQGLEFTAVTGLAYVRHRDYSATLGRFIKLDPIGFEAGDNNWYRFVGNGPTGKTDPSGLECDEPPESGWWPWWPWGNPKQPSVEPWRPPTGPLTPRGPSTSAGDIAGQILKFEGL